MAKSDSLQNLRNRRKATHKLLSKGINPAKKTKSEGPTVPFSEANSHKASSCTKQRGVLYKTKESKPKMKFAKMPRKMKKQVKKELLAAA